MLELIRRHQPISRADLARLTGVFRSSVSDIVDELLEDGLLWEARDTSQRGRGRVPMILHLNEASCHVLGLNIRPIYSQLAYAGLSGEIRETLLFDTPTSAQQLVGVVSKAIWEMSERLGRKPDSYQRLGIAIPGHVDAVTGRILWLPTHEELSEFSITQELECKTGIPALADNDCNLGALSELWLSKKTINDRNSDFVFLNISDFGTGAGVVVNGEIYLGHDSRFAAEVGHMIVEPSGLECLCGRHGCWEMYVSNNATWKRVNPEQAFREDKFGELLAAATRGEQREWAALQETARYLSLGISNIGFIFNPAEIVVAGRISQVWDLIREQVKLRYGSKHLPHAVRPARLSADDSLLHGAICLALREVFAGPKFGPS